jgi:hypothetical protein
MQMLLFHCWTQMMLQKCLVVVCIDSVTHWDHAVEDDAINFATVSVTLTLLGFWRIFFGCVNLGGIIHLTSISIQGHMLVPKSHYVVHLLSCHFLLVFLPLPPGGRCMYQYKMMDMLHVLSACILCRDFIVYSMNVVTFKD